MKLKLCNQKIKFLISLLFLFAFALMTAQSQKKITGTVLSASDKMPLPGASVIVKGASSSTSTDLDGVFTISVPANATILTISYIGYKGKDVVITSNSLTISLIEDTSSLDEVVVVGYGTQKKSDVTGAVSKVNLEKAVAIPTTNISEMLRGQAAGVQVTLGSARPGGASNILIRGRNSIRGGNDPLVVLDGFPIENINDINPDDIASIEVLKDASAQAIYGARASNGVILVTTKKGKEGKMRVNFNS